MPCNEIKRPFKYPIHNSYQFEVVQVLVTYPIQKKTCNALKPETLWATTWSCKCQVPLQTSGQSQHKCTKHTVYSDLKVICVRYSWHKWGFHLGVGALSQVSQYVCANTPVNLNLKYFLSQVLGKIYISQDEGQEWGGMSKVLSTSYECTNERHVEDAGCCTPVCECGLNGTLTPKRPFGQLA